MRKIAIEVGVFVSLALWASCSFAPPQSLEYVIAVRGAASRNLSISPAEAKGKEKLSSIEIRSSEDLNQFKQSVYQILRSKNRDMNHDVFMSAFEITSQSTVDDAIDLAETAYLIAGRH